MAKESYESWEEKPNMSVERMIVQDTSGVEMFRVRYGSETIFISSDGTVESSRGVEEGEFKKKVLERFEELKNEPDWKEREAELREQLKKDEEEWK